MNIPILTALVVLLVSTSLPVWAEVSSDGSGWLCGTPAEWEAEVVTVSPTLTASNFIFDEDVSPWTGMDLFRVQFVIINRASEPVPFNAHFVGIDEDGRPTIATTVAPVLDRVDSGLETQEAEIYVRGRPLAKTTRLCVSFVSK